MAITLTPPDDGTLPFKQIKLHSGTTYRLSKDGSINVDYEEDAQDLEREGWRRDARSEKAARHHDQLLRKAVAAEARRFGAGPQRAEIGEVDVSDRHGGRLRIAHDHSDQSISIHGVSTNLKDLGNQAGAFTMATENFGAAEDAEEQTSARTLIGSIVASILDKNPWLADKVKQAKLRERYGS